MWWVAIATSATASERPVVLVVGDSLSAAYGIAPERGWVALLQQRLRQQGYPHRVVNASISGETTRGGASRIDALLQRHRPTLTLIALGANDGLRGLPLEAMERNLERMVTAARDAGSEVVLIGMRLPTNYGPLFGHRFAQLYRQLAQCHEIALVPFLLEGVGLRRELFQPDGLHPTAEAQPRILENVWPVVEEVLGRARHASPNS